MGHYISRASPVDVKEDDDLATSEIICSPCRSSLEKDSFMKLDSHSSFEIASYYFTQCREIDHH